MSSKLITITILLALAGCATNKTDTSSPDIASCTPFVDKKTDAMESTLNFVMDAIKLDSVLRLMGDFLGYKVLRPTVSAPDLQYEIQMNYPNKTWLNILKDVCERESLTCWVNNETLYFVPDDYMHEYESELRICKDS